MKVKFHVSFPLLTCCLLAAFFTLFASGCTPKPVATPQPQNVKIAVIDMNKALQAHPKYQQGAALQQQLNTLLATQQVLANQQSTAATSAAVPQAPLPSLDMAGGQDMRGQQLYQEKMSAKQAQLKAALDAQYVTLRKQASDEYDAYSAQLDKEYQQPLFDLQLKLKTLQLAKEEAEALQTKLDKLHKEKADKLSAKEQQLSSGMTARLTAEQQRSAAELDSYAQQTAAELRNSAPAAASSAPADLTNMTNSEQPAPVQQTGLSPDNLAAIDKVKAQMASLEASMIQDIENQCGKIAQESGYDIVVTNVTANIHADDITAAVIARFNN